MADKGGVEKIGVEAVAEGVNKFLSDMQRMEAQYDRTVGKFGTTSGQLTSAASAASQFAGQMRGATAATEEGGGAMDMVALAAGALGGVVAGLVVKVIDLALSFGQRLVEGVRNAIASFGDFAREGLFLAGRFEELEFAAVAIGHAVGYTQEQIRGYVDGLRDVGIRGDTAAQVIAQMARNQIDLAQSTDLAVVAQGAAVITGEDSSDTLRNLIWAVTTHNTRMLRTMGIMTDLTAAEEAHAASLGLTVDQLTQQQRIQADVNAVLESSAAMMEVYDAAMQSPTKRLRTLTDRLLPELQAALGAPFLGAWNSVIGAVSRFVVVLTEAASEGGALYPILVRLGAIASILADAFAAAVDIVGNFVSTVNLELSEGMATTAENAMRWGVEIVASLAEGMVWAAAAVLTSAMNAITNLLTWWLAPGSAPRVAPKLGEWGAEAFTEYLRGFTKADFGVLEGLQRFLKQMLTGTEFRAISVEIARALAGGEAGEGLFARIAAAAGEFGAEVAKLAREYFALAKATEAVNEAERRLEQAREAVGDAQTDVRLLTAEYNDLLRAGASDEILAAKLAEIVAAEDGLNLAQQEVREAEDANEQAREQLDLLREQSQLQERLLSQLLAMAKARDEAARAGGRAAGRAGAGAGVGAGGLPDLGIGGLGIEGIEEGITSRMREAIDAARLMILERLGNIFEPLGVAWESSIGPTLAKLEERFQEFVKALRLSFPFVEELAEKYLVWLVRRSEDTITAFGGLIDIGKTAISTMEGMGRIALRATLLFARLADTINADPRPAFRGLDDIVVIAYGHLKDLWSFLHETFVPFVGGVFTNVLNSLRSGVLEPLGLAILGVRSAIEQLWEWMGNLANIVSGFDWSNLRDLLPGGSPSPFEESLRGITGAMRELSTVQMPRLATATRQIGLAARPVAPTFAAPAPIQHFTRGAAVTVGPNYIQSGMDEAALETMVRRVLRREFAAAA